MALLARAPRALAFSLALLALSARTDAAEAPRVPWAAEFLRVQLGLRENELARVARGETVVRMVEDPGPREIAVLAVTRLPAPPAEWTAGYPFLEHLRRANADFIAMGQLGVPPRLEDLDGVAFEERFLEAIRKCRLEKCVVNAPKDEIERYRRDIDWQSADPGRAASLVFRDILRNRMIEYQRHGDASLPVFVNRSWRLTTADLPRQLLGRRPGLAQLAPALDAHFRSCPMIGGECGDGAPRDVFYWCREKMWRREIVGLYHATFDDERTPGGRRRVAAEKLVYANHYLLGALTVTGLLEDPSGTYLFLLNRSETDSRGSFNFIERALASRLIRRRVARQVEALRVRFSRAPAATGSGTP